MTIKLVGVILDSLIFWICLSYLLGYYDVEHNVLMAFCASSIVSRLSPKIITLDKGD